MDVLEFDALVKTHVLYNMTNQVMREFKEETDVGDEIEGFVGIASETASKNGPKLTVHQWWLVSNEFACAARGFGEIIVDTPFGAIWGCQYDGTLFALDINVQNIVGVIDKFRRSRLIANKSE